MTDKDIKRLMAEHVQSLGGKLDGTETAREIAVIAREMGFDVQRGNVLASFARILGLNQKPKAREPHPFREYRPAPHPRLADIQAAQPKLWTPGGTGNGVERINGYGRGQ